MPEHFWMIIPILLEYNKSNGCWEEDRTYRRAMYIPVDVRMCVNTVFCRSTHTGQFEPKYRFTKPLCGPVNLPVIAIHIAGSLCNLRLPKYSCLLQIIYIPYKSFL